MEAGYAYSIAFYLTAAVAVASALMVVWHKNPVVSALNLVLCFFSVAVIYVLLKAHFLAAIQILLYAGAVLVLFLMMVMLLNLSEKELGRAKPTVGKAVGLAAVFGFILTVAAMSTTINHLQRVGPSPEDTASILYTLGEPREALRPVPEHRIHNYLQRGAEQNTRNLIAEILASYDNLEVRRRVVVPEGEMSKLSHAELSAIKDQIIRSALDGKDLFSPETRLSPTGYVNIKIEDLRAFIKAVAWAKFKHDVEFGSTASVGRVLFTSYVLPFEAASILLFVAIIGVIILSRRAQAQKGEGQ